VSITASLRNIYIIVIPVGFMKRGFLLAFGLATLASSTSASNLSNRIFKLKVERAKPTNNCLGIAYTSATEVVSIQWPRLEAALEKTESYYKGRTKGIMASYINYLENEQTKEQAKRNYDGAVMLRDEIARAKKGRLAEEDEVSEQISELRQLAQDTLGQEEKRKYNLIRNLVDYWGSGLEKIRGDFTLRGELDKATIINEAMKRSQEIPIYKEAQQYILEQLLQNDRNILSCLEKEGDIGGRGGENREVVLEEKIIRPYSVKLTRKDGTITEGPLLSRNSLNIKPDGRLGGVAEFSFSLESLKGLTIIDKPYFKFEVHEGSRARTLDRVVLSVKDGMSENSLGALDGAQAGWRKIPFPAERLTYFYRNIERLKGNPITLKLTLEDLTGEGTLDGLKISNLESGNSCVIVVPNKK
jgi:hypothetical protein